MTQQTSYDQLEAAAREHAHSYGLSLRTALYSRRKTAARG